jgi:DNA invertase Pin-like site-specific DNA recombinase
MRFGGYVRVSKVGKRAGDSFISPVSQREKIAQWCQAYGHELIDVREDLDVSGALKNRPNLEALVGRIEAGQLDGLVVARLDRFGRSLPFAVALESDRRHFTLVKQITRPSTG